MSVPLPRNTTLLPLLILLASALSAQVTFDTTGQINMSPMTYAVNGKQYVAVNAGNGLFVFGLRE